MKKSEWKFPLPRPHCGVAMGNGCFGALVWGAGSRLSLTVNRADCWDRRGGELIAEGVAYGKMCAAYDPDRIPEKLAPVFPAPGQWTAGRLVPFHAPAGRFGWISRPKLFWIKPAWIIFRAN